MRRSSGWCVSEGVKCGGGLSGRKYVSLAEVCSVEGDREARVGRTSAGAMMNRKFVCTLKAVEILKMAAVA